MYSTIDLQKLVQMISYLNIATLPLPPGSITDAMIASGSKLSHLIQDIINLRNYGAVCDGVTDDTAAVQAAITAIGSTGATLIIPGPTLISSNLTFSPSTVLCPLNGGYLVGKAGSEVVQLQIAPLAGPVKLLMNMAARATTGMNVYPEWFGADRSGSDASPGFNAAYSFLRNVGGTIIMSAGTYTIANTITNNWSHIRLIGQGLNITTIAMNSATRNAIDNIGVSGSPLANTTFEDFSLLCSAPGSSTGSVGLNLSYNAFTHLRNMQVQEFLVGINMLRATNTQVDFAGASYVNGTSNGFIGFNIDGGGTGTAGNASSNLRDTFVAGNNTLSGSIGYRFTGAYMSDLNFDNASTAGTNYGYYLDYSTSSFNEDVWIRQPIVDQFTSQGIFVNGLPAGGKLNILAGWINPKAGANNATTDIYITGCVGSITIDSAQIVADANTANTTGVYLSNSTGVTVSACQITNTHIGVNSSAGGYHKVIGTSFKNDASAAAQYINMVGDARSMITGNSFEGFATTGILVDNTSSGTGVVANNFRITNIGTRVSNNATGPIGSLDGSTGLNSGY